jgi:amidase
VPSVGTEEYAAARARCVPVSRTDGIDRALQQHRLDALVTPAFSPANPIDLVNEEWHAAAACSQPAALAGYPLLTVPVRLAAGLPVAVAFWGTAGSEPVLIEIAAGFEAARDRELGPLPEPTFAPFV